MLAIRTYLMKRFSRGSRELGTDGRLTGESTTALCSETFQRYINKKINTQAFLQYNKNKVYS